MNLFFFLFAAFLSFIEAQYHQYTEAELRGYPGYNYFDDDIKSVRETMQVLSGMLRKVTSRNHILSRADPVAVAQREFTVPPSQVRALAEELGGNQGEVINERLLNLILPRYHGGTPPPEEPSTETASLPATTKATETSVPIVEDETTPSTTTTLITTTVQKEIEEEISSAPIVFTSPTTESSSTTKASSKKKTTKRPKDEPTFTVHFHTANELDKETQQKILRILNESIAKITTEDDEATTAPTTPSTTTKRTTTSTTTSKPTSTEKVEQMKVTTSLEMEEGSGDIDPLEENALSEEEVLALNLKTSTTTISTTTRRPTKTTTRATRFRIPEAEEEELPLQREATMTAHPTTSTAATSTRSSTRKPTTTTTTETTTTETTTTDAAYPQGYVHPETEPQYPAANVFTPVVGIVDSVLPLLVGRAVRGRARAAAAPRYAPKPMDDYDVQDTRDLLADSYAEQSLVGFGSQLAREILSPGSTRRANELRAAQIAAQVAAARARAANSVQGKIKLAEALEQAAAIQKLQQLADARRQQETQGQVVESAPQAQPPSRLSPSQPLTFTEQLRSLGATVPNKPILLPPQVGNELNELAANFENNGPLTAQQILAEKLAQARKLQEEARKLQEEQIVPPIAQNPVKSEIQPTPPDSGYDKGRNEVHSVFYEDSGLQLTGNPAPPPPGVFQGFNHPEFGLFETKQPETSKEEVGGKGLSENSSKPSLPPPNFGSFSGGFGGGRRPNVSFEEVVASEKKSAKEPSAFIIG